MKPSQIIFTDHTDSDIIIFQNIDVDKDYDTPLFTVDLDIIIDFSIFKANKRITSELGDFLELTRRLKRMREGQLKGCYFNPILDQSFEIRFDLISDKDIDISINGRLFDNLYEGKLEFEFFMKKSQLSSLIENIEKHFI